MARVIPYNTYKDLMKRTSKIKEQLEDAIAQIDVLGRRIARITRKPEEEELEEEVEEEEEEF